MDDKKTINEEDLDDMLPKEKTGVRFLVECNCVLPQYRSRKDPIWHKFPVFVVIDEDNEVEEKIVSCNNCGVVHKILEVGLSKVMKKENPRFVRTKQDIKMSLPTRLGEILEQYDPDISVWENVEFIVENERWGSIVPLFEEELDESKIGKCIKIINSLHYKIEDFKRQEYF